MGELVEGEQGPPPGGRCEIDDERAILLTRPVTFESHAVELEVVC